MPIPNQSVYLCREGELKKATFIRTIDKGLYHEAAALALEEGIREYEAELKRKTEKLQKLVESVKQTKLTLVSLREELALHGTEQS